MKDLDPAALDCLAALVDAGSFERAAQSLSITQSAVSQRLRALETQVGQLLVVRSRPLRLTEPGKVLLRFARQWQAMQADVARELGAAWRDDERVAVAVNACTLAPGNRSAVRNSASLRYSGRKSCPQLEMQCASSTATKLIGRRPTRPAKPSLPSPTSRSGATIIGAMLFGFSRRAATEFSFFLGIPTLIAAGAYDVLCWPCRAPELILALRRNP